MLDCGGVQSLRIRFPGGEHPEQSLGPGVHGFGRSGNLAIAPVVSEAADLLICIDRGGIWLRLADGLRGVHVNGRPVQRVAMLRLGDTVYLDGVELVLLPEDDIQARQDVVEDDAPGSNDTRMLLRCVGGRHHGRCFGLTEARLVGRLADCGIRIDDPSVAEHHARLEAKAGHVVLHGLADANVSKVNGQAVRDAVLMVGDQVVFGSNDRFVVESPGRKPLGHAAASSAARDAGSAGVAVTPDDASSSVRRWPWLLLAALLIAASLSALLLFGAR